MTHAVYGLILALAALGELLVHEIPAGESAVILLAGGAVLLAAHLFSERLGHLAATQEDLHWRDAVRIGRSTISVATGWVGAAALMGFAAITGIDSNRMLVVCIVLGLVAIAHMSFVASAKHRLMTRVVMSAIAVVLGVVIVLLESRI
jgi:hypothetical protein